MNEISQLALAFLGCADRVKQKMSSTVYENYVAVRLGNWFRKFRFDKGAPPRTVAEAADMEEAHLSKIEFAQRLPMEEQTVNLTDFFGVDETEAQAERLAEKFRQKPDSKLQAAHEVVCFFAEEVDI